MRYQPRLPISYIRNFQLRFEQLTQQNRILSQQEQNLKEQKKLLKQQSAVLALFQEDSTIEATLDPDNNTQPKQSNSSVAPQKPKMKLSEIKNLCKIRTLIRPKNKWQTNIYTIPEVCSQTLNDNFTSALIIIKLQITKSIFTNLKLHNRIVLTSGFT